MAKENLIMQGIDAHIIEVVLNGVDGFKETSLEEKKELRKKYKIDENEIVVGYLARVEELKGHKYLIEAMNIINQRNPKNKFKLLLMGSGTYEETAKELVKSLELEDKIIFTGFINDVEKMLNIVDIQVNASYLSETTNLSLLEGMSLGIPSVATACGGTSKMIEDWKNGLLVEKANSLALADGIEKIVENQEKFDKMKEISKQIFKERYTSKVQTSNIERIYESMVK